MTRLPAFFRSIRFRLAITHSMVLFSLALVVIAGINYAIDRSLDDALFSRQVRFTTFVTPDGSTLTLKQEIGALEQLVNQRAKEDLRRYSMWAMLALFPASIASGWLIADRALRPIGRITAVAKEIQSTDLSRRIGLEGPRDELHELAETFDAMVGRLEAGVEQQRNFIQDTSHELRNPLAVMATNLDVVLTDPTAGEAELRSTAEIVRRTVDRATRSVDDLVIFARSDVPESARELVSLRDVVGEVVEEYAGPIEEAALAVEVATGDAMVSAERGAVKRALGNLVNNAVRLTRTGSTVRIGAGVYGDFAWVGVEDEGPGVDPRDHGSVFQRHWSADGTSLRSERRSGLGLAIARQVAQAHRGALTVRSVRGAGAAFVLWLPLRSGADLAAITDDGIHPVFDPFAAD